MKPRYRLHCNLEDRKPLWWVSRPGYYGTTFGFSTPRAACEHAAGRTWVQIAV